MGAAGPGTSVALDPSTAAPRPDGGAWESVAWEGVAWEGVAWEGVAWEGVAWEGVACRSDLTEHGLVGASLDPSRTPIRGPDSVTCTPARIFTSSTGDAERSVPIRQLSLSNCSSSWPSQVRSAQVSDPGQGSSPR